MKLLDLAKAINEILTQNPELGNANVYTVQSSSGETSPLSKPRIRILNEYDLDGEFGFVFSEDGLKLDDKVILISIGA